MNLKSLGIGSFCKLIAENEETIIYEYGYYNLNEPKYENKNRISDGIIPLELLKDYCGISNKITFWLMASDYENTLSYSDDLSKQPFEILDLPKRCGGVPNEYYEISDLADTMIDTIPSERARVERAIEMLNMISSYNVYRRWQLLAEKVPKPRTYVTMNFDVEEFKKKYKKI